jgi:hypothetical protein
MHYLHYRRMEVVERKNHVERKGVTVLLAIWLIVKEENRL